MAWRGGFGDYFLHTGGMQNDERQIKRKKRHWVKRKIKISLCGETLEMNNAHVGPVVMPV
jgi:hypothetical protein